MFIGYVEVMNAFHAFGACGAAGRPRSSVPRKWLWGLLRLFVSGAGLGTVG